MIRNLNFRILCYTLFKPHAMKNTNLVKKITHSILSKNYFKFLIIFLFLIPLSHAENTETKEKALVSKIIDAYGGKKQLAKVVSISAEGHVKDFFSVDEGIYFRYMKRDRKLFVDIKYFRSTEKRILDGDKGYRGTEEKVTEVKGLPYDAMVYQYNQLNLPYGLVDGTFKVTYLRKENIGNTDAEVLKLEDKYGHDIEVYLSPKDFLIHKVTGYFKMGQAKTSLSAEFTDFRKVEGILLPFKVINHADALKISETYIVKYTINPKINDSAYFSIK
jgi:hypothetical protein